MCDDFYYDGEVFDDEEIFPESVPMKKILLYILDERGHVEDIIIDIDDIHNYVNKVYGDYPEGA